MPVIPPRNLAPESEPWGRWVNNEIQTIERVADKNTQDVSNTLASQSTILKNLGGQLEDIAAAAAAAQLAANAAAAAAAQANAAIAALVTGTNYSALDTSGTGLNTTDLDYCAGTVTVPAGYTSATVLLVAVASVYNTRASSDFLFLSAVIQGVKSREIPTFVTATTNADVTTASSVYLTGLTPGGTISLGCRAHAQGGVWGSTAANRYSVEAIITFFK